MVIEVSLSPALYPFRTIRQHHATVAVDLLRATTAVCAAFQAGCREVVPLDSLEALEEYRPTGYKIAAERGGKKLPGSDYGNSPTEYLRHDLAGVRLAYSTTNGTVSILKAADADLAFAGSFANLTVLEERLRSVAMDVVVLCSGWKNDFCIEDTLVAGALIEKLSDVATPHGDSAHMAVALWQQAKADPYGFCLGRASHVQRLKGFGAEEDIRFAFRQDTCPVVPILKDGILTL